MRKLLFILSFFLPFSLLGQEEVGEADEAVFWPAEVADSVESAVSGFRDLSVQAIDSLGRLTAVTDSLKLQQKIDSLQQLRKSLDTLRLSRALDSLQQLELAVKVNEAREDSIRQALDYSSKLHQEIQSLQRELNEPVQGGREKLQNGIDQHTARPEEMNGEALGTLKEQTGVEISNELPWLKEVSLKRMELPADALPEVDGIKLPDFSPEGVRLPEIKGIAPEGLTENIGAIPDLSKEFQKAGEYTDKVDEVARNKLNQVKNQDQWAEQQLMQREETAYFKDQAAGAKEPAEEFLKYRNEDQLKESAVEEAPEEAVDLFAGKKDQLRAARNQLTKYKGRYNEVKSIKELPKNPLKRNPLSGKPWQERWVVGSVWQFHKQDQFMIDLGPFLAYRVSDNLEIGAAYQWRLTVDKEASLFLSGRDWLSGYSCFADYKIKKGFFIRGAMARLNHLSEPQAVPEEGRSSVWVSSFQLGAGKSYTFYKSFKGYSLVQYSFSKGLDKAFQNPLELKIGFYLNGKSLYKSKNGGIKK